MLNYRRVYQRRTCFYSYRPHPVENSEDKRRTRSHFGSSHSGSRAQANPSPCPLHPQPPAVTPPGSRPRVRHHFQGCLGPQSQARRAAPFYGEPAPYPFVAPRKPHSHPADPFSTPNHPPGAPFTHNPLRWPPPARGPECAITFKAASGPNPKRGAPPPLKARPPRTLSSPLGSPIPTCPLGGWHPLPPPTNSPPPGDRTWRHCSTFRAPVPTAVVSPVSFATRPLQSPCCVQGTLSGHPL